MSRSSGHCMVMGTPLTIAASAAISFLDAMQDPALFGPWFRPEPSWARPVRQGALRARS
jgi:hypothetical protein